MATLIDPPEHFYNHNTTGFPPVPPEAHQKANFAYRRFVVSALLRDPLSTGTFSGDQRAIHLFMTRFVVPQLTGFGFWMWGSFIPQVQCVVCHRVRDCVELFWFYKEEVQVSQFDGNDDFEQHQEFGVQRKVHVTVMKQIAREIWRTQLQVHEMSSLEQHMHGMMAHLSKDYTGGPWQLYALSNGGFYMAPVTPEQYSICVPSNHFEGVMSADAAGVVATLFVLSRFCINLQKPYCKFVYSALREFISFHPEVSQIYRAID